MTGTERVGNVILGKPVDRQPIYGWVFENLKEGIIERWGSIAAFEDLYEFDMAHIFGGPPIFRKDVLEQILQDKGEVTPDVLLASDFYASYDDPKDYENAKRAIDFHKERGRFCYKQTPGFFECFNEAFGIQNQLMYLLIYPDEMQTLYTNHVDRIIGYADRCIDLGVDMIHISDDWGSQNNLMFSPELWRELIYPNVKRVVDHCHARGVFVSLHSDGCIAQVTDEIADLGFDLLHPWQESAGMSYDLYLEKYADRFAILGGVCVQTALGILPRAELEREIRRVFSILKGKRWVACTSHFVQNHCSIDDLAFAYDLIYSLARE